MRRGRIGVWAAVEGLVPVGTVGARAGGWKEPEEFVLEDVPLSEFLADELPGLGVVNDHGVDLGGIGSDLWHGAGDGPGTYWMITDRGPNGEDPRTFPVPEFTP